MVRRYNRLLVALHVLTDASIGVVAFILAYLVRFELGVFDVTKGQPPFAQYANVLPFIAVIVPLGFHLQGLYRLRRGRSRIDVFFNVLVGSIFAVVIGVVGTLYFQAYYVPDELKAKGAYEVSQLVWAIFLVFTIALGYLARKVVREILERRWVSGLGLRRVLIAGAGDLGRHGRRPDVRAPRARLPRRSASSTTAPAAITSATAGCRCSAPWPRPRRSPPASGSTTSTSPCRWKSTSRCSTWSRAPAASAST